MSDTWAFVVAAGFALGMWFLAHGLDSLGEHVASGLRDIARRK